MVDCCYKENDACQLLRYFKIFRSTSGKWCRQRCWPNNQAAQLKMLSNPKLLGLKISNPPEGKDLLEWVKEQVECGNVEVNKSEPQQYTKKKLPSKVQMAKNLLGSVATIAERLIERKEVRCCKEQRDRRKAVCDNCEHQEFVGKGKKKRERCLSFPSEDGCGCYLNQKRKWLVRCGQGKWDAIDAEYEIEEPEE